jgi:hypothetical protein
MPKPRKRRTIEAWIGALLAADRLVTAYHEAGHAVVAYHLGLEPRIATIVPNMEEGTAGKVMNLKMLPYAVLRLGDCARSSDSL